MTTSSIVAPRLPIGTWLLLAAIVVLAGFHAAGLLFFDGFMLDLGSLNFPTPKYFSFVEVWTIFGTVATILLTLALAWHEPGRTAAIESLLTFGRSRTDRQFLVGACLIGLALPLCLRVWLLHGAPLADDEGAYLFAARLLASGRLWVSSPPLKLFFDQNFMINDGRLYPVYFLGWPALLATGVWTHAEGLVNPLLSACTVPALYGVLRRVTGRGWARCGVLLFLSAPFVQMAAATELSHTSCLLALTLCVLFALRAGEPGGYWPDHAGCAAAFAFAFCIRPQSAVALGVPMLALWASTVWRLPGDQKLRAVVAFAAPSAALAALFLAAQTAQNGSPWITGYSRSAAYIVENHFRFTSFVQQDLATIAGFDFMHIGPALVRVASALFRLNYDLFGWPSSLALLILARPGAARGTPWFWAMVASYLMAFLFLQDWGIDTFGPMHAFELTLPIMVLSTVGARELAGRLTRATGDAAQRLNAVGPALVAALIATAWLGFVVVRWTAVHQIATHLNLALEAPEQQGLHHAVVFAPFPFAPACGRVPRHFVLFRPVNDPDLRNDVLWVNQLDPESERTLMTAFPGRTGHVMTWTSDCRVQLAPLR